MPSVTLREAAAAASDFRHAAGLPLWAPVREVRSVVEGLACGRYDTASVRRIGARAGHDHLARQAATSTQPAPTGPHGLPPVAAFWSTRWNSEIARFKYRTDTGAFVVLVAFQDEDDESWRLTVDSGPVEGRFVAMATPLGRGWYGPHSPGKGKWRPVDACIRIESAVTFAAWCLGAIR